MTTTRTTTKRVIEYRAVAGGYRCTVVDWNRAEGATSVRSTFRVPSVADVLEAADRFGAEPIAIL